jgi:putative DNA methylase
MAEVAKAAVPCWRPETPLPDDPRNFWTLAYGLRRFGDLFTDRQLVTLTTLSDILQELVPKCENDAKAAGLLNDHLSGDEGGRGAKAYAEGVALLLAFVVDKCAEALSTICTWSSAPKNELVVSTFRRQALPMTWGFAEANPFADSSGSFEKIVSAVARVCETLPAVGIATAIQADSQTQGRPQVVVSTDPPYYDNIGYADLSDSFYVWLQRSLRSTYRDLFATMTVPKADELVATPYRHGGKDEAESFFLEGMTRAIRNIAECSHPAFPVTIYYAFKQSETAADESTASTGWETFLDAVVRAGVAVVGTWPMRSERSSRSNSIGTNALASSIILACRPRKRDAATASRKDFVRELGRLLPTALAEMTADPIAAVAPVDLAQAAIGPGMGIFSAYAEVLEADGSAMTVRSALVHINKAIDSYFSQTEEDLDADTRFCIDWFQQRGFEAGPFGEADVLARAKGTAVAGVEEAGVISAAKGRVRLLRAKEYPNRWDPTKDNRVPVWEACHQMCRALSESESDAGALLARMPEKQDGIRQLAYRLYTICERQKWAEEARLYNELITSWPAIVEESHKAGHRGAQLQLI